MFWFTSPLGDCVDYGDNANKVNLVTVTIPHGRMRGDADCDQIIDIADQSLIIQATTGKIDAPTGEDFDAYNTDGDAKISATDAQYAARIANGSKKPGDYGEATGNWTVNPQYASEVAQFYCDITVPGMTADTDASFAFAGEHITAWFDHAELSDGSVRIYVIAPPIEDTQCTITFSSGTGKVTEVYSRLIPKNYLSLSRIKISASDWALQEDEDEEPIPGSQGTVTVYVSGVSTSAIGFVFIEETDSTQYNRIASAGITFTVGNGTLTFTAASAPSSVIYPRLLLLSRTGGSSVLNIVNMLPQPNS